MSKTERDPELPAAVTKVKSSAKRFEQGICWFEAGVPLSRIDNDEERRGWKCARARNQGRVAHSLQENPHLPPPNGPFSYEELCLDAKWVEGFMETHSPRRA